MDINEIVLEIKKQIREEENKPLKVSIMGQTGVGKSSLLNALFGVNLKTDAVKPCTKEIEKIVVKGEGISELWFYDLPGIGESQDADSEYFKAYAEMLKESDVVLWAIHSDNRSTAFDVNALNKLINQIDEETKAKVLSKITFVLTKTDLLSPPAWIYGKINDKFGDFTPNPITLEILKQKQNFYQETFIKPYLKYITAETFNDCNVDLNNDEFTSTKFKVSYKGFLDEDRLLYLSKQYPQYRNVFLRIFNNYEVVPCSSQFKYNLTQLMVVITNKLGDSAISRFKKFTTVGNLTNLQNEKVKEMCNIIVFDTTNAKTIFNFQTQKI